MVKNMRNCLVIPCLSFKLTYQPLLSMNQYETNLLGHDLITFDVVNFKGFSAPHNTHPLALCEVNRRRDRESDYQSRAKNICIVLERLVL